MEIGTLHPTERENLLELLDGWALADGWAGRDFFRRYIERDPTYADENVFVAREGDALLSCVQIFPRRIRILGHAVPMGGIGSVFTRRDRRSEGLAGAVLEAAVDAMRERGMPLSLLFSERVTFYQEHGYCSWKSQRALAKRSGSPPGVAAVQAVGKDERSSVHPLEILPFDADRDLRQVEALHEDYSAPRNGPVVRDAALWRASFELAGNPDERFTVARRGDELAAYLRVTRLYERPVATEVARAANEAGALAALVDASLAPREDTEADEPLKDLLLPAFDDLEFTLALEQKGISSQPLDDPTNLLRCLDGPALAQAIHAPMWEGETDQQFLERALPLDEFVFWPADRF